MMANIGLNLPTDITWERICVTNDMMDPFACDDQWPPVWHTSIAVFKYIPADEYQPYQDQRIIYYKVTATLTAYQPQDQEIHGTIDWEGLSAQEIADFETKLNTQKPCTGAMLQVTVAPAHGQERKTPPDFAQYPYFLDVQPKQRALYEQASDSQERASRTLESLSIKKGAGSSDSTEVLDVDQGYSVGVQAQAQGYGVGVNVSRQGQWGSKQLGQQTAENVRTTDSLREQRDTVSHSTQISQMYTLFQASHLGTNRLMFYIAPRPHVLEQPSGLINGPRAIDGIQEIFLIVCLPKQQEEPCLSVRLDTSHLTDEVLYDYDRSVAAIPLNIDLQALPPKKEDPDKLAAKNDVPDVGPFYDCYEKVAKDSQTTPEKPGYVVESVDDLVNDSNNGNSNYQISSDNKTVTLTGEARGHACFRNGKGDDLYGVSVAQCTLSLGLDTPVCATAVSLQDTTKNERPGSVTRHLLVHLRSEKPTVNIGDKWTLLVTTRGLCCCGGEHPNIPVGQPIIAVEDLSEELKKVPWQSITPFVPRPDAAMVSATTTAGVPALMNARQANVLTQVASQAAHQIASRPPPNPAIMRKLLRSYVMRRLVAYAATSPHRRAVAHAPLQPSRHLPERVVAALAEATGERQPTPLHVLGLDDHKLAAVTGLSEDQLLRLKLQLLGFPVRPHGHGRTQG
jgi:hypothetical protein